MEYLSLALPVRIVLCVCLLVQLNYPYCDRIAINCFEHIGIRLSVSDYDMGTRGAWAIDFLHALGNASPSEDTVKLVAAWTRVENTEAQYNPLATTQRHGTYTKFNNCCGGEGVKNYSTRQEGIDATVETITQDHFGYDKLRDGLRTNDPQRALYSAGFDTWGSGSSKVLGNYVTGDWRDEPLKSEDSNAIPSLPASPDRGTQQAAPQETKPALPPYDPGTTGKPGEITEQDVRLIAKQFLGIVFIGIGGLVFVIGIMKTDAAQAALSTAVKVAV